MTDEDLPPLFLSADSAAIDAQGRYFLIQRAELAAIVAATVFFEIDWATPSFRISVLIGSVLLMAAIAVRIGGHLAGLDNTWHRMRSTAERVKAIAWQFAVGGGEFAMTNDEAGVRSDVERELQGLVEQSNLGDRGPGAKPVAQITPAMERLRQQPVQERRAAYLSLRLQDQKDWYERTSAANRRAARRWHIAVVGAELLALLLAIGLGLRWFDFNWAGVLGAGAAAALAWQQAKQYSFLASSYEVGAETTAELIESLADGDNTGDNSDNDNDKTSQGWAERVAAAEAIFAQEQGLWSRYAGG